MTTAIDARMATNRMGAIASAPPLHALRGAIVVIKYGGAAMTDAALADAWAKDVVLLQHMGIRPVVVHGGGAILTRMLERLGIESRFVDGHRATSAEAAEVAEMVLSGRLNKEVVSRLNRAGGRAVGISGTDAGLVRVRRRSVQGADLGFVGDVESIDGSVVLDLLAHGYIPVISSTAAGSDGHPYNINADLVAAALAGALGARALVFLSDVVGVLENGERISRLSAAEARRLLCDGVATAGMRPKLEAALAAAGAGVASIHFGDGRRPNAVLSALSEIDSEGTRLSDEAASREEPR